MGSLQGQLLVATVDLRDPNFFRSVVLIFRHDDEGAAGLILNRRTKFTVKQAWEQASSAACNTEQLLHLGGPCQGPLMALHSQALLQEIEVLPAVYFSASGENLERLVLENEPSVRFFVGYAGWGVGQLERELKEGSWLTTPATVDLIFGPGDDLWETLTKAISTSTLVQALKIKHVPRDPSLN